MDSNDNEEDSFEKTPVDENQDSISAEISIED